ncbi:hypothetical protein AMECASPLE_023598 [Ameca splendens]|uniref:Uncharacterized protein n=1 Tax=Ameca splendens TaxID=208324 RepID=A0ABV0XH67_9TELE
MFTRDKLWEHAASLEAEDRKGKEAGGRGRECVGEGHGQMEGVRVSWGHAGVCGMLGSSRSDVVGSQGSWGGESPKLNGSTNRKRSSLATENRRSRGVVERCV